MIKYEYFGEGELLIVKYIGNITKSDIISFFKVVLLENENILSLKEVLADYREAKEIYNISDLFEISEARKKLTSESNEIQTVFLVGNPKDTAIAILFAEYYEGFSNVNICSTISGTTNCLSMKITDYELEKMLVSPKFEHTQ